MSGPKYDWKGSGKYYWQAEWPGSDKPGGARRFIIVKLITKIEAKHPPKTMKPPFPGAQH